MYSKKIKLALIALFLGLSLQGCALFGRGAPTPFVLPSPDFTLTAIFSVLNTATATPPLVQTVTSTLPVAPSPTCCQIIVVTATPEFTSTNTPPPPPPPTATATHKPPKPTRTPTVTPTPVPTVRPGPVIAATFLSTAPVIDGNLAEWSLRKYKINQVVYGSDRWFSDRDLFATVMLGWDNNNLYLGVEVEDQRYVQEAKGKDLYKGDSLEILMDKGLNSDYFVTSLSSDDYQLGISPGSPTLGASPEAYLWYPRSKDGKVASVVIAASATADGYAVEVAIPWSVFDITPGEGKQYGFAFSVSDNDKEGEAIQESLVSNDLFRHLTDPTTWGVLRLRLP